MRVKAWRCSSWLACLLVVWCGGCSSIDALIARGQIRSRMSEPTTAGAGRVEIHQGVVVAHVYGTHEEMGRQYGTMLGPSLRAMHRYMDGFVPSPMKHRFMKYAQEHEADLPPELLTELHAIAEAAQVPYVELLAMNVVPKAACSGLAVWGKRSVDGQMLMGRNSDYFSMGLYDRGMLVVVYHPTQGAAVASVNFLGMVGAFTGMNDNGVSFGNMLVFNAAGPQQSAGGLPVQAALRMAAHRAGSTGEMVDILRAQKHAIPMNVMAADGHEAAVLELSPLGVVVRHGDDGALAASNHFRTESLRKHEVRCSRYDSLIESAQAGPMGVSQMERALFDARIRCLNVQAVVFEPAERRMHVSINHAPASAGPYILLDREMLFGAATRK